MDLDWCIVCDRHTSGGIYCSQECRFKDTPKELQGKPPVVPGPLDVKKLAVPFNSYSSDLHFNRRNNNNEEDEDDEPRNAYKTLAEDVFVSFGPLTNNNGNGNTQKRGLNTNVNQQTFYPITNNSSTKKRISSKFMNPVNVRAF